MKAPKIKEHNDIINPALANEVINDFSKKAEPNKSEGKMVSVKMSPELLEVCDKEAKRRQLSRASLIKTILADYFERAGLLTTGQK